MRLAHPPLLCHHCCIAFFRNPVGHIVRKVEADFLLSLFHQAHRLADGLHVLCQCLLVRPPIHGDVFIRCHHESLVILLHHCLVEGCQSPDFVQLLQPLLLLLCHIFCLLHRHLFSWRPQGQPALLPSCGRLLLSLEIRHLQEHLPTPHHGTEVVTSALMDPPPLLSALTLPRSPTPLDLVMALSHHPPTSSASAPSLQSSRPSSSWRIPSSVSTFSWLALLRVSWLALLQVPWLALLRVTPAHPASVPSRVSSPPWRVGVALWLLGNRLDRHCWSPVRRSSHHYRDWRFQQQYTRAERHALIPHLDHAGVGQQPQCPQDQLHHPVRHERPRAVWLLCPSDFRMIITNILVAPALNPVQEVQVSVIQHKLTAAALR